MHKASDSTGGEHVISRPDIESFQNLSGSSSSSTKENKIDVKGTHQEPETKETTARTNSTGTKIFGKFSLSTAEKTEYNTIKHGIRNLKNQLQEGKIDSQRASILKNAILPNIENITYHKSKIEGELQSLTEAIDIATRSKDRKYEYNSLKQMGQVTSSDWKPLLGPHVETKKIELKLNLDVIKRPNRDEFLASVKNNKDKDEQIKKYDYQTQNKSVLGDVLSARGSHISVSYKNKDDKDKVINVKSSDLLDLHGDPSLKKSIDSLAQQTQEASKLVDELQKPVTENRKKGKFGPVPLTKSEKKQHEAILKQMPPNHPDARKFVMDQITGEAQNLTPAEKETFSGYLNNMPADCKNQRDFLLKQMEEEYHAGALKNMGNEMVTDPNYKETYKHILKDKPDGMDDKAFIVNHMLYLSSQNSLNTIMMQAASNGFSPVFSGKADYLVDFDSAQVCLANLTEGVEVRSNYTEKTGLNIDNTFSKDKKFTDTSLQVSMMFDCKSENCHTPTSSVEIFESRFSPEQIMAGFMGKQQPS